ncbi:GNAT family N-acetyltransferase [Undibacterium sp. Jales W-56]|uniref:GNAT family N-acetyltransferase n=1 Tax=Undibacterium sp. Jales W-56 TaxID=2897325 RepID=UPI0021D20B60|nr:GNAT family N-acetyltransferase [Undibacterium sp. Jales W-56]MCU6433711.1 GNAT family N-acetyltransferase [Undibacterium sp. Jales W-56]
MSKPIHYRTRVLDSLSAISANQWDALLSQQSNGNPFLSYAFLHALHESGSASANTGWQPRYLTIWDAGHLLAAMPLYEKTHSYGEYVFDWAWADAYQRHGFHYYPKLLSAIPFTPVTGNRLLARDQEARTALLDALQAQQASGAYSSIHILFPTQSEAELLQTRAYLLRAGIQFHWINQDYLHFEHFLSQLEQKKRKNIRAERRKVAEAGVTFRHIPGEEMQEEDWRFFKRCYDHTYADHHSSPYLNLDFFLRIGASMPQHLHLIFAERNGRKIASSLLVYDELRVYGRYWGCIEQVPCLHFETAYYQAIEFCIAKKIGLFEGGAQGEHKMARGFLPQKTCSAHFLAQAEFSDAVAHFLERETNGVADYLNELNDRIPFKSPKE